MEQRCHWAKHSIMEQVYHDVVWGKPCHDELMLFQYLVMEGQQAGLSWYTILQKWDIYLEHCQQLDPMLLANCDDRIVEQWMNTQGLIHHRRKLESLIQNARAYQKLCQTWGSLDAYIWQFTNGQPIDHHYTQPDQIPTKDDLSTTISKQLKKMGFLFVGPTIIYSYLQAIGVYNDHLETCPYR